MTATIHVGNVLDVLPTLPAGSVNCVVTYRLGRQFIGAELNPEYAEMAERRIESWWKPTPRPAPPFRNQMQLEVS